MVDLPRTAGRMAAVPLGALARWRRGKPMHPRGAVFRGVLERFGGGPAWGVPFLDASGREEVVVRFSRGAGLPAPLPDVLGIAVRLGAGSAAPVDLLLSSTGRGALTRLVPVPRVDAATVHSSIMAYRTAAGPLRLAALPVADDVPSEAGPLVRAAGERPVVFDLAAARGLGEWRTFGRLTVGRPAEPLDPDVRFDAVCHPPPGLAPDGPLARFRAPAYAAARQARSEVQAGSATSAG
ncbi:phosphodiesterase [Blastococcus sp. CCUG 61487]|uniref:phosphodiesterase n=1 Tax=Blastococcus sp. CCUG 61487 TaxID=1840703 RepID=UPI0010BF6F83|nr:phosphodiesterase [Blastococcus sp. CCUG 61487]TKJ28484.1 phosphodiesterase [Blastococcus sp. CCUG 61487]